MRRLFIALTCALVALAAVSQSQQGLVKTKGRGPASNPTAGTPLPNASISLKNNNTVVSAAGGKFAIPVRGGKYSLQSVKKKGYELLDPDILFKSYSYSSNQLVIAMVTREQKSEDVEKAKRQIRRRMQSRIDAMEDSIQALMDKLQITQQQYSEAMKALDEERDRNGELISKMAEHYAKIDYDQINEIDQQIEDLIMAGDLGQAFSLLRSKGAVDDRLAEVQREEAALDAEAAELERRLQTHKAALAGHNTKKNDLAEDCYKYFKAFVMDMRPDSALKYIEMRANIDTLNSRWQFDAASYCMRRGLTERAEMYFQRALKQVRQLAENNPEEYEPELAMTLYNAALIECQWPHGDRAINDFQEAVSILSRLAEDDMQVYGPYLAAAMNNLALFCMGNDDRLAQCKQWFEEARDIYWSFAQEDPPAYIPLVADVLNNMAQLYEKCGLFDNSDECYQQALGIYSKLAESNPKAYNGNVAVMLSNIAALRDLQGVSGEDYLTRALEIYRGLDKEDPQRYGPLLAGVLNNLSRLYYNEGRHDEGCRATDEMLDIYRKIVPDATLYKPLLASRLYEHAIRLYQDGHPEQSEPLLQESLTLCRDLARIYPDDYLPEVAKVLRNLAATCNKLNRLTDGEKLYQEELAINLQLASQDPPLYNADVARSYGNLSNQALLMKDWDLAIDLASKGLAIDNSKLFIHANMAAAHLFKGETEQALEIYTRYKSQLRDAFLDDLEQFSALGIIPVERLDDVNRVRQLLSQ